MNLGNLVLVRWRDSFARIDDDDTPDDYICETVGWIAEVGERFVKLASEHTPEGNRGVTWIAKENVLDVASLGTGATESDADGRPGTGDPSGVYNVSERIAYLDPKQVDLR